MRTTKLSYHTLVILLSSLILFRLPPSCSLSTGENRTISANDTIVSPGNVFELGLFRSASEHTPHWYLGIWYKNDPKKTRIWVANRYNPFYLSVGTLHFSDDDLVLSDENNSHVWSITINRGGVRSPMVAQLLDNGNFVVKDSNNDDPDGFLWQSFDFPTDTLVPGMKLGMDLKTGTKEALTSWDPDNPSNTGYSFQLENQAGLYELFLVVQETSKHIYRSDLWDGIRFGDIPLEFSPTYVTSVWGDVSYVGFVMTGKNNNSRLTLAGDSLELFTWIPETMQWISSWYHSYGIFYHTCGANSYSSKNTTSGLQCNCIKGFDPAFRENWALKDLQGGCQRKTRLNCTGDQFLQLKNMKLPDTGGAYVGIGKGQVGCVMWTGTLNDFQNYGVGGRDLYVKVAAIDHGSRSTNNATVMNEVAGGQTKFDLMSFTDVAEATNHFSEANKLGEGGFGVVYKGTLPNKTTVAVKRLAITSSQGINEFKTEVGYMSEEYALHGKMSERSDIFSFGVNLLEIVTGKRNIEFCNYYHGDSMLDYVWRHFDEGNSLQVVDPNFVDSSLVEEEVVRCIQVALLCVQQDVDDRPSTESVALMLATTMMEIPVPKKPNYFYARFLSDMASSSTVKESTSINQVTLSSIVNR
ncbi:PREDICTED: receptor-like serine/threonine-protein kinase SD1-8 [Camelina sativa]|uniref:Receptor-like serine/threonine-protein kinase SD1-8 n=2 Tax=Camelina sativa TaxID=90675 RepID=A0ABM1QF28_CAMSA|nr:PREDICTED: receptor-like serine/threonine-protein kinase SD1-8 [Camelina sativa]